MHLLYVSTCIAGSYVFLWKWQSFRYAWIYPNSREYYRNIWPEK